MKIIPIVLSAFMLSTAAFANETVSSDEKKSVETIAAKEGSKSTLSFLELSSVVAPGESVGNGDLVLVNRKFDAWNLRCDVRLSTNKHACFVEQTAFYDDVGVQLRIGNNKDGRTVAIAKLPASFDIEKGLRLKFSGLEKTLERENFVCVADHCLGGFYLEGFVQEAILGSRYVGFIIPVKGETQDYEIALAMSGFDEAISAAQDPFGRKVSIAVNENKAKAKPSEPKKPVAQAAKPVAPKKAAPKAQAAPPKQQEASAGKSSGSKPAGLF